MANTRQHDPVHSTCGSIQELHSLIESIPQLAQMAQTTLVTQLQATISLCTRLQQQSELLAFKGVMDVLRGIGNYAKNVKESIEAVSKTDLVDWTTYRLDGRTISGISSRVQLLTNSVFVGAVSQARLQRKLELPPEAETACSKLILNTSNAAVLEMGAIMDRMERIMEGRILS